MIRLKNVSYVYTGASSPAINHLTLDIGENEFVAVVGRNGSGKSTLARLLNGLLIPDQGIIEVDGLKTSEPNHLSLIRQKVGLLLSSPDNQLIFNLVEEDVAFGPENLGLPSHEIRNRVDAALKTVSMEEFAKHPPYLLSGGQRQKVCIAGLLALKPAYMVLDEPTSMLDGQDRQQVMTTLLSLKKQKKISLVLITHDLQEAVYADRLILLEKGEIKLQGSPAGLITHTQRLKDLGVEPLALTSFIDMINGGLSGGLPRNIYQVEDLVKELCQLK